jgi:hypothetical protein
MNDFYDFSDLRLGMRVNVEGTMQPDGTFRAMQISIKDDAEEDEIEATIESTDVAGGTVTVLGLQLLVDDELEIKDLDKSLLSIEALRAGMRIKTKGRAMGDGRFAPIKIKVKSAAPDSMDEIEGMITDLDPAANMLRVMGFPVVCDADVEIEA